MKLSNNVRIILASVLITVAVFVLNTLADVEVWGYIAILSVIGGLAAIYIGYRYLMVYFGKKKVDEEPPAQYAELRAYESPIANGQISLYFDLPERSDVSLRIIDHNSQVVKELINEHLDRGSYPIAFDTTQVANGTYFYELITHNYKNSKKLIIDNR